MSLSMDDKLLGEKSHYYCSSSEDEEEDPLGEQEQQPPSSTYQGTCVNTGPKGVIEDWRKYKQLETEKREADEAEKAQLVKKLSMTCQSYLNDATERKSDCALEEMDDEFLLKYRQQRLEEMRKLFQASTQFGKLMGLTSEEFTKAVDSEKPQVMIVIHIYEEVANGVPALLVYRNKELIGNFVRLSDEFGDDFYATDVESFLVEHGLLPSETTQYGVQDKITGEYRPPISADSDSGSDFEID